MQEDPLFKDFTYFKKDTFSCSNEEDIKEQLSNNKVLGPLLQMEIGGNTKKWILV